ncbi:MAG: 30S ribosomal protein S8 [Candidatus Babeliales bacterium]
MSIDSIGDFLTIIRNGIMASKPVVVVSHSSMRESIAHILKEEGFIKDFVVTQEQPHKKEMQIVLKYVGGESVIHEITRKSTPGRRMYRGALAIAPVIGGLGITILSTNKGVMTQKEARKQSVGGEVLCIVW